MKDIRTERGTNFEMFRYLITNNRRDQFRVAIIGKKNKVRGWSCESRMNAVITADAWLSDHPEHSHAMINGERYSREKGS